MASVSLELFKRHVRADDFSDDDGYLLHLLDTAEEWVSRETGRPLPELLEEGGGSLPLPLCQAVMLMAGHWYNQREGVSSGQMREVPYTLKALVKPFTRLSET